MNLLSVVIFLGSTLIPIGIFYLTVKQINKIKLSSDSSKKSKIFRHARTILSKNPNDPSAKKTIADVYFKEQNWKEAYNIYHSLYANNFNPISRTLKEFNYYVHYGVAAFKYNRLDQAFEIFEGLNLWAFQTYEFYLYYGLVSLEKGEYRNAMVNFRLAEKLKPNDLESRKNVAFTHYKLGNLTIAAQQLEELLSENYDEEIQYILGTIYTERNQTDRAIKIFHNLIRSKQYSATAFMMLGHVHRKKNDTEKAQEYYERSLKLFSNQKNILKIETMYCLANVYVNESKRMLALKSFREIEHDYPDYKDTRIKIAELLRSIRSNLLNRYLKSGREDFEDLTSKIVKIVTKNQHAISSTLENEHAQIFDFKVETRNKQSIEFRLFRFIRSIGITGELLLRDLHDKAHSTKYSRCVCISAGEFSAEAQLYASKRAITLIAGPVLQNILKVVS